MGARGTAADAAIGERFRVELWRQRRDQRELAAVLGISAAALGRRLRGAAWPFADVIRAADELGVEVVELVELAENPPAGIPVTRRYPAPWRARNPGYSAVTGILRRFRTIHYGTAVRVPR